MTLALRSTGGFSILQFKASNYFVRGARRFFIPHRQPVQRRWRSRRRLRRSIYFVLPLVGTTKELAANPDLLPQTVLLDPLSLRRVFRPTTPAGTRRASGYHYLDIALPSAILHSKPVEAKVISAADHIREIVETAPPIRKAFDSVKEFMAFRALLPRKSAGAIIT